MVEVDFSGNFLNSENCKANDIGVIIDEGELKEKSKNGNTWNQLVTTVEFNGKQYSHSYRSAEGKRFQEAFGKDTKTWVGQKCKALFIPYVDKDKNIQQGVELVPVKDEFAVKEVASIQA